ncbi:hypothetical protein KBB48_03690 [Candidatus Shapirobacteria bacterium]|nr:hypothetical protein [Candidatus Shapirobacteria bacterium]
MTERNIGYTPPEIARMPETRLKIVEAKFIPRLSKKDLRLNILPEGQLDFIASVLS